MAEAALLSAVAPEPVGSTGPDVLAALGARGAIADVYRHGRPALGVDPARLGAVLAQVDAHAPVGATLAVCVQLATAIPLLATGSGAPVEQALAGALAGTSVVALAATDEGAGSDLTDMGTEVAIDDDGLTVTGTKRWITSATTADAFLVLARHRPGRHFTNFTWALVPADAAGVRVSPADTDLFDGAGLGHIEFDGVRLGKEHLVGRPGRGLAGFARHIAVERLAGALWAIALCTRVLNDTRSRLENRTVAGEPLFRVDSVRQRFATCVVLVRQLKALCAELGESIATRHDAASAALLKASVGLTADRVLADCAQLQGAGGFASDGAQRLRAQAAVFGIGGGTTEIVLSSVADAADRLLDEIAS